MYVLQMFKFINNDSSCSERMKKNFYIISWMRIKLLPQSEIEKNDTLFSSSDLIEYFWI